MEILKKLVLFFKETSFISLNKTYNLQKNCKSRTVFMNLSYKKLTRMYLISLAET